MMRIHLELLSHLNARLHSSKCLLIGHLLNELLLELLLVCRRKSELLQVICRLVREVAHLSQSSKCLLKSHLGLLLLIVNHRRVREGEAWALFRLLEIASAYITQIHARLPVSS